MEDIQAVHSNIDQPVEGQFRQRFERKFFIAPEKVGLAYAFIRQFCRSDAEYPKGIINSLYFDDSDLDQHERSVSGDFTKDKVRVRWYGETEELAPEVPVFLELKSRRGFASSKKRERFEVANHTLNVENLNLGIIDKTLLDHSLMKLGHFPEKPLQPIILVAYSRYRFTEMSTGIRVSLDYDISSTFIARQYGYGERKLPLRGAVLEVKGPSIELPVPLRRMKFLDADWSRFSKYSHCIDAHQTEPGSLARLWPSGRVRIN